MLLRMTGPDERRSLACSERSPECNLAVSDAESLEHQHADHIEDYEWKPHCEICRRHPFQRAVGFSIHNSGCLQGLHPTYIKSHNYRKFADIPMEI